MALKRKSPQRSLRLPLPKVLQQKSTAPEYVPLALPQRTELLGMFNSPVFQIAWNNASLAKPSVFPSGLNTPLGGVIAVNRLHELRGWELFAVALLTQTNDPKSPRKMLQETFPDEARS